MRVVSIPHISRRSMVSTLQKTKIRALLSVLSLPEKIILFIFAFQFARLCFGCVHFGFLRFFYAKNIKCLAKYFVVFIKYIINRLILEIKYKVDIKHYIIFKFALACIYIILLFNTYLWLFYGKIFELMFSFHILLFCNSVSTVLFCFVL